MSAPTSTAHTPQPMAEIDLRRARPQIRTVLERALDGAELSQSDAILLFDTRGDDLKALLRVADRVRAHRIGDDTTFVVTRNINFTNICYMGCRFCGFAKRRSEDGAELLPFEEIARRAQQAYDRGATEVCIQGGLHPHIGGDHYRRIVQAVKAQIPQIHIHAFSPFEIWYGAKKSRLSPADFLQDLKEQGLGSVPGTAAEILDTQIRKRLTRDKLSAHQWVDIIKAAHGAGLPTTSTIMYGHIDAPRHWAAHIALLRDIQKETGGFTEFVPLGFVHYDSPLYQENTDVRPGPTTLENLRMHAVARLMLQGWIDNIQASWVKLGPALTRRLLRSGVNDLGGTLMNESISRASGAKHGQEITPTEMTHLIRDAGRDPVRRSTLYRVLERYDDHDPADFGPLVPRDGAQTIHLMDRRVARRGCRP